MQVVLTHDVWQRMRAYVDNCRDEISGMGKIERDGEDFRVVDIVLFDQTVSAAHSDITTESLAKFQVEVIRKGDSLEDWTFWWHSHAAMKVFFSGTDTETIDASTEYKYLVSLVTNHKHELTARVDTFEPVRLYKMLDVVVEEADDTEVIEACKQEIAEKVKRRHEQPHVGYRSSQATGYQWPIERNIDFEDAHMRHLPAPDDQISSLDELEDALERVGTDDYAVAIETYEQIVGDLETEVDYLESLGEKKSAKKKRKELGRAYQIGRDNGLDIYATQETE